MEGSLYVEAWAEVGGSRCKGGRERMRQTDSYSTFVTPLPTSTI